MGSFGKESHLVVVVVAAGFAASVSTEPDGQRHSWNARKRKVHHLPIEVERMLGLADGETNPVAAVAAGEADA